MSPKILYVCTACPFDNPAGMGHRTRGIASLLDSLGDLSIIAIMRRPWSEAGLAETARRFNLLRSIKPITDQDSLSRKFRSLVDPGFLNTQLSYLGAEDQTFLEAAVANADVNWVHTLKIANIAGIYRWPRSVVDVDDFSSYCNFSVARSASSLTVKMERIRLGWLWKRRERRVFDRFDAAVVCKEEDRLAFGREEKTFVMRNGFDVQEGIGRAEIDAGMQPICRFGMIGTFDYLRNRDAIQWFLEHCWPEIRFRIPEAELRLVGRSSERFADATNGVRGLGFVVDAASELQSWTAMVVPTRLGGGSSVKVAEALSCAVPVVATSHGAQGYGNAIGRGIVVADDPVTVGEACAGLWVDREYRERMRREGLEYFQSALRWKSMLPEMRKILASVDAKSDYEYAGSER